MSVKRIVPDIKSRQFDASRQFYVDVLGLKVAMDMGFIVTLVSPSNPTAQISLMRDDDSSTILPQVSFTVFLTELAEFPFGASEYIAEFTTNAAGKGSVRVDAVIQEAFAFDGSTRVRKELDHVVVWFADPKDDDVCFRPGGGPVTPFDGDGQAGATVLSSKNFLPGAPLR